jgi:hypothetical protein
MSLLGLSLDFVETGQDPVHSAHCIHNRKSSFLIASNPSDSNYFPFEDCILVPVRADVALFFVLSLSCEVFIRYSSYLKTVRTQLNARGFFLLGLFCKFFNSLFYNL